jgi:hypothetical protein
VFVELMPLLKQRTLLITVARIDEKLKVNVIPVKAKEGKTRLLPRPSATQDPQRNWTESLASISPATLTRISRSEAHCGSQGRDRCGGQRRAAEGKDRATDLKTRYRHQERGECNTSRSEGG